MPRVSHDGLHVILWQMRTSNGTVRVQQQELAEMLCVTKHTMNRLLARMVTAGRLVVLSGSAANVVTYEVKDPAGWRP